MCIRITCIACCLHMMEPRPAADWNKYMCKSDSFQKQNPPCCRESRALTHCRGPPVLWCASGDGAMKKLETVISMIVIYTISTWAKRKDRAESIQIQLLHPMRSREQYWQQSCLVIAVSKGCSHWASPALHAGLGQPTCFPGIADRSTVQQEQIRAFASCSSTGSRWPCNGQQKTRQHRNAALHYQPTYEQDSRHLARWRAGCCSAQKSICHRPWT